MTNMIGPPLQTPNSRGYTLIEMIIVVVVIAALVALSVPAIRGPLGSSELRDAAKQVRAGFANARLWAIESGVTHEFRFRPGTGRFEVIPRPTVNAGAGLAFASDRATRRTTAAESLPQGEPRQYRLPEGVRFVGQQTVEPPVGSELTAQADAQQWSTPLVFYPNGRTKNTRIRLSGAEQSYIDVTLRGVTGSSRIGELVRRQQP